jgi:phage protein D
MAGEAEDIGGDNAPTFNISVNDNPVSDGVRALIQSVEYESNDGMADLLKIVLHDPIDRRGNRQLSDSTLFQPGNEISVEYGYYGAVLDAVGRGIVRKVRPIFPRLGVPILEVICYTKDCLMMDNSPEPLKVRKVLKNKKVQLKNSKAGRRFIDSKYSDAVMLKAQDYGMTPDVDESPDKPHEFIHKAGMTDYDFVKGLSNLTGFYFWVDYDFADEEWTLHFKNPETYVEPQEKKFNFKWGAGEFSTLLEFEPELAINSSITKLRAEIKDPVSGNLLEVDIEETTSDISDPIDRSEGTGEERITSAPGAASQIKVFLNEFSFEIRTNRHFKTQEELAAWTQQWFRRQRENFVMSKGKTIGVETLRARQIHTLSGLGVNYNGDYQFNLVRHVFKLNGYECEIACRKVIGSMPQLSVSSRLQPGGVIVDTGRRVGT